ncbi:unnamed protein product [Prorocentrum cordatum]|uniref:Replication factor A C-terminal domain-containing protein n=1 Tax=Prorocentrum cordatum TaxID=2364126 RepID=A0ABN9TSM8_9DINO|nr:unnamed protein product [Polarella glacialis]
MGEIAFVEAFGPAATDLHTKATTAKTEKNLLTFSNVNIIHKANQYITSRLPYYVQLKTKAGSKSVIETAPAEGTWATVPTHHPFLDIAKITKVQSDVQHCVFGVVARQPGAKWQETRYGPGCVCNAILRAATIAKDYKICETCTASLSALTAVIVPGNARDLDGVYEAHSVAIMGVTPVLRNEGFVMRCCATCEKQVPDGDHGRCDEHGEAPIESRWIIQLELTDGTGHCAAMLYHDVAMQIPGFPDPSTAEDPSFRKFLQTLRAAPYSVRLIYRINALREVSNLEAKLLLPTLTSDGVVGSWRLDPTPITFSNTACPFAKCASVTFDPDLGFAVVDGSTVTSVRVLVTFQDPDEDEETTVPDTAQGLRVTRVATCALEPAGQEAPAKFQFTASGLSSAVQWLVRADGTFFLSATKRKNDNTFVVQTHHKVTPPDAALWA